jgi:hypothetical protein
MRRKSKEKKTRRNPTCGIFFGMMEFFYMLHLHEGVQFAGVEIRIHT